MATAGLLVFLCSKTESLEGRGSSVQGTFISPGLHVGHTLAPLSSALHMGPGP